MNKFEKIIIIMGVWYVISTLVILYFIGNKIADKQKERTTYVEFILK